MTCPRCTDYTNCDGGEGCAARIKYPLALIQGDKTPEGEPALKVVHTSTPQLPAWGMVPEKKTPLVHTIHTLTDDIVQWADAVFPDRQPQAAFLKMFEEMGELIKNPRNGEEYADVCIMLFDLAHMHGVDLTYAILAKMATNRGRIWEKTDSGTFQHVVSDEIKSRAMDLPVVANECGRAFSNGTVCTRPRGSFCAGCL